MALNQLSILHLILTMNVLQVYCSQFKCPAEKHQIVVGREFHIISAKQIDNPSDTTFEWEIIHDHVTGIDIENTDTFSLFNEDTDELTIYNADQLGELDVKLTMEHETRTTTTCHMKIMFVDAPYLGIDLGTTFSCIAYQSRVKNDQTGKRDTHIIENDNGQFCIPTAIYFPKNKKQILFGKDALDMLPYDPENVIYDIKRIIGRQFADKEVTNFMNKHLFKIVADEESEGKFKIVIPNRQNMKISPEQALASVVIHLVEIANKRLGRKYDDSINVVISIPAIFNNAQRKAVKSVANIAKVNAKLLVVEPSAAAIAHIYYTSAPSDDWKLFVIFDWGGGTLDCSVLQCHGMTCDVKGTAGNSSLGGIDFDRVIRNIIVSKLINDHGVDPNDIDYGIILRDAEEVKKSLTHNDIATYKYKNKPEIIITKNEFEKHNETQKLLYSAIDTLRKAITTVDTPHASVRYKPKDIRKILLVGGTSNIPIVVEKLKHVFEKTTKQRKMEDTENEINRNENGMLSSLIKWIWEQPSDRDHDDKKIGNHQIKVEFPDKDPQLMVVIGSAVLGGSLQFDASYLEIGSGGEAYSIPPKVSVRDVIPLSLGFEVCIDDECGKMSIMIPKDSKYPLVQHKPYCQHDNTVTNVTMELYEGDSEYVINNHYISKLTVKNLLPRKGSSQCNTFHMMFNIDKNGIADIHGIAHKVDGTDGEVSTMSLSLFSSLSECEIKEMQNQMGSWFGSKVSQLLEETPCTSLSPKEITTYTRNYVYLDMSGSMTGFGIIAAEKAFERIAPSLMQQYTSITLFGDEPRLIMKEQISKWKIKDIIRRWRENIGGNTFMWKMILDDILLRHKNLNERPRLTIITDGEDTMSPPEYKGLKGMDTMMTEFKKSKITNIEYNIIVLSRYVWKPDRYRDLCHVTGGLFYKLNEYSESVLKKFEKEFADKYNALDVAVIEKIRHENKEIFKQNNENKPTELKFDYKYFI
eukprot:478025_1